MLGFLAVALLQKPVTVSPHAMRLDALLKEVSTQTGETYKAGGPMIAKIVFVGGPARPVADLRAELATATYGKWRRIGDEWLLDEDRDAVVLRERARLAGRIAQVKKQQDAMRAEAVKPFDETAAKELLAGLEKYDETVKKDRNGGSYLLMQKLEKTVPANVALRRVIASLDPTDLAALEIGTAVYSDRPTRLQRPLPSTATAALRQVERDQATWARFYPDNAAFMEAHRSTGWLSMDPRGYPDPAPSGSLRLVLKVQAFEHGQTMFSANFVDKTGRFRQFGSVSIEFENRLGRDDPAPKAVPKEPKLTFSPEAMAFSETRRGRPAAPILRSVALAPERKEPLDLLIGEGLQGVAKARAASVVACLGDDAINFSVGEGQSPSEFLSDLWSMNYEVREAPGSFLIRPRFGPENVDRPRLGALLRIADAKGYVPLDDFADYAAATPTKSTSGDALSQVMMSIVMPGLLEGSRADWRLLALWGGFTRAQRQVLLTPGSVPWREIPQAQRDRLTAAVLRAESYEMQQNLGPGEHFMNLGTEPTEILANGFAAGDGVIGSSGVEEGVFAPSNTDNPYEGGIASAWTLASAMVSRERKPDDPHYDGLPKKLPNDYLFGRILNFGFQLRLTPTLTYRKSGQFGEFDMRGRPKPLEALPDSFRKKLDKALEQSRSQPVGG